MKTFLECFPCFMQQALRAGKISTQDPLLLQKILVEVGGMFADIPLQSTPPQTGRLIYQKISELTGIADPYAASKQKNMQQVAELYPHFRQLVQASADPLRQAVHLAIAGNVIDLGVNRDFEIQSAVDEILQQDFAIDDYELFRQKIAEAENILYLGDNSAETYFDKLLLEVIDKPIIYAVKERPIINDATRVEAQKAGIDQFAQIISSGSDAPGTILPLCNREFLQKFQEADLIISKGQGNFEGLSEQAAPIFFLLRAKCSVIAAELAVPLDSLILKYQSWGE
ncbi:MAG: ARMT1-like domain-containing protein [Candidatus Cloacimonadales bacterium]